METVGQVGGALSGIWADGGLVLVGGGSRLVVLDASDPAKIRQVGISDPLDGLVSAISVEDNLAYVALGEAGIAILDISDADRPEFQGALETPGQASDVAAADGRLYVADGSGGLRIYDVTDPMSVVEAGSALTQRRAEWTSVAAHAGFVYVGADGFGVAVVDARASRQAQEVALLDIDTALDLAAVDGHLYVASDERGFIVVDIRDPTEPEIIGSTTTEEDLAYDAPEMTSVALVGDFAVAVADVGVVVVDVRDPRNPGVVSTAPVFGSAISAAGKTCYVIAGKSITALDVSKPVGVHELSVMWFGDASGDWNEMGTKLGVWDDHAIFALGPSGFAVVDLRDPLAPTQVHSDPEHWVEGLVVADGVAYLAVEDWDGGLRIVDITTPSAPEILGKFVLEDWSREIAADRGYVYVAGYDSLSVVDATNPVSPTRVARIRDVNERYEQVDVAGDTLYAAASADTWRVIAFDISSPRVPRQIGSVPIDEQVCDLVASDDMVYVLGLRSLSVYSFANPREPRLLDQIPSRCGALAVHSRFAYVVEANGPFSIYDVGDPYSLSLVTEDAVGYTMLVDLAVVDDRVVGLGYYGLHIYDAANPEGGPVELGDCDAPPPGSVYDVGSRDEYAFLTDFSNLRSYDVSDPTRPLELDSVSNYGAQLTLVGDLAYLAGGSLSIVDASDPMSLTRVSTASVPDWASGVAVAGNHAYVVSRSYEFAHRLTVFDVTDPSKPVLQGSVSSERDLSQVYSDCRRAGVAAGDGYVYIATGLGKLLVVDVRDPGTPRNAGSLDTGGGPCGVTVVDGRAYVAGGSVGMLIFDLADPAQPQLLAAFDTPGTAEFIRVRDGFAYLADGASGVQVIDVRDPRRPLLSGSIDVSGYAASVAPLRELVLVAAHNGGLGVVQTRAGSAAVTLYLPLAAADWRR